MHDKHNNTTENDENLSRDKEFDESEDMGILSSDEESDPFNITKGIGRRKGYPKQQQNHL